MTDTVLFTHIRKTAGTSIKEIVMRPNFEVFDYRGIRDIAFRSKKIEFLDGHYPYGVHKYSTAIGSARYFVMMRNPVSRCLSFYYNNLKWNKHRGYEDSRNMSENEFYEIPTYQNKQARMIAGVWAQKIGQNVDLNDTILGEIVLLNAKRNLKREYEGVGFTSKFERSADHFAQSLGVERKRQKKKHKSVPGRRRKEDLSEGEIKKIRNLNSIDVRIYNYARKLFSEDGEGVMVRSE